MKFALPQIKGTLFSGIGCCWHIAPDTSSGGNEIDCDHIAFVDHDGREFFLRTTLGPGHIKKSPVLHAHFELRASESFTEKPSPDIELSELEAVIDKVIGKRDVKTADYRLDCRVPWNQISLGSILAPIIGLGEDFAIDHNAMLTDGRFTIAGEHADFLSFSFGKKIEEPFFSVSVEGTADDSVSWDMFARAASQLLPEFNRLVLSKTSDNESGGNLADG
jgi:hypothetical protein